MADATTEAVAAAAAELLNAPATNPGPEGTVAAPAAPEAIPSDPGSTGADPKVEPRPAAAPAEAPAGQPAEGTAEPPTEYFGVDLSGLPADQREELIAQWSERDRLINTLQRGQATEPPAQAPAAPAAPPTPVAPEPEPELSDADLAEAFHLDLEDPADEKTAQVAIPLARTILLLKEQVEGLAAGTAAKDARAEFTSGLSKLETEYGVLPSDSRAALVEAAVTRGIDADSAYWAAVGPTRLAVMQDVTERLTKLQAQGKASATTPRPGTNVPVEQRALESKDTKSAVAEAAKLAAQELGFDWDEAWANRKKG